MTRSQSAPAAATKRWWLWLPLLGLGAWLAIFGDKSPAGDAAASPSTATQHAQPARPTKIALDQTQAKVVDDDSPLALVPREQLFAAVNGTPRDGSARDLFIDRNWNPPPPPATQQAAPTAPPLPYTFIGKKLDGETWEVYLARGEQTFIARSGEIIESVWRIDRIAPPDMVATYLPLGLPQTLSIGEPR